MKPGTLSSIPVHQPSPVVCITAKNNWNKKTAPPGSSNTAALSTNNSIKYINPKHEIRNTKQIQNSNFQNSKQKQHYTLLLIFCFGHLNFGHLNLFRNKGAGGKSAKKTGHQDIPGCQNLERKTDSSFLISGHYKWVSKWM